MILRLWVCIVFSILAGPLGAQEFIESKGQLSDDTFYKMVACAAPENQTCQKPFVKWSQRKAQNITVSLKRIDPAYPRDKLSTINAGIALAITELNAVPNGPRFRRVNDGSKADIQILLLDTAANSTLKNTNIKGLDGVRIQHAWVQIWWNNNNTITRAAIVFSKDVSTASAGSIMLEELTQALGFITDLRNPYYEANSIFSEDSNTRTDLAPQDIKAIQRHYAN